MSDPEPAPIPTPEPWDPVREATERLMQMFHGAFQQALGAVIQRMRKDEGFRATVLFSLTSVKSLGIQFNMTPQMAAQIYGAVATPAHVLLECERLEVGKMVAAAEPALTYQDLATLIVSRSGRPAMPEEMRDEPTPLSVVMP